MTRRHATFLTLWLLTSTARAQVAPPTVRTTRPLGAAPAGTVAVEVRGADLDGATGLRFDDPRVGVEKVEPSGATVKARVTFPADAAPGPSRFRVVSPRGLSNPGQIYVGRALPVTAEVEANNGFRKAQKVESGSAVEGSISPGDDVDVFAVAMTAGETLVAEAVAARAGSGLDPLVTVYAPNGRELASDDDTFGRDAAVSAVAPVSGRYFVQIQDANGRNNDANADRQTDRPYRLEVGRIPLVTSAFPAGARRGERTALRVLGVNLGLKAGEPFLVDTGEAIPLGDRLLRINGSNGVPVRVVDVPEVLEKEPNDEAPEGAQAVTIPAAINGRFDDRRGGDLDTFRLLTAPGREGTYRITALAARVGSPADPVLTVLDVKGDPQAEDDDALGRDARIERPVDARTGLLVSVRDYYGRGGGRFVYRLEVEPVPARGLTVTADLGGRSVPRGGSVALGLAVDRRGYDGPVTVLAGVLPAGVSAAPVTLAAGAKSGLLLVSARDDAPTGVFPLRLTARDAAAPAAFAFRDGPDAKGPPGQGQGQNPGGRVPRANGNDRDDPALAVAVPASLGVRVEPVEVTVSPGGSAAVAVTLDRRSDAARKAAVRVRLAATEGDLAGLDAVPEATVAAGSDTARFTLKARPDARPTRRTLTALARFADTPDAAAVASAPSAVVIADRKGNQR